MDISQYTSSKRLRKSTAGHDSLTTATQSDRARLIYSAAFRRLQQKAQVFSLESNSAVRSRLTHSIEVSHIGRYIVSKIIEKLLVDDSILSDSIFWKKNSLSISNVVETACLMHDIGNPPFGHFGEAAIVDWFSPENIKPIMKKSLGKFKPYLLNDFLNFDGNPQGFRIVTKLQGDDGITGLNLTCTQLASLLKYTSFKKDESSKFNKKIGYFETEREIIEDVWKELGMEANTRHPLGFLMEASDDISYCLSDMEDGIEKGILQEGLLVDNILENIKNVRDDWNKNNHSSPMMDLILEGGDYSGKVIGRYMSLKTTISNLLVDYVVDEYITTYDEIISFSRDKEIIYKGTEAHVILSILKGITSKFVFSSREVGRIELTGYSAISGILNNFSKLLQLKRDEFTCLVDGDKKSIISRNLLVCYHLYNSLPSRYIKSYKNESRDESDEKEWVSRVHLLVDYISGMTDDFALEVYQRLNGIKVS